MKFFEKDTMSRQRVAIGTLGGTISMTPCDAAGGVVSTLNAAQLAALVPGLEEVAEVTAETLFQLPSPSLLISQLLESLAWAESKIADGACAVVLTQGTDTIEETAFFLDLYWKHSAPLIITGAMRAPLSAGADGPSNLLAAVQTAVDEHSRERGVLVVMNDTIHRARWVCKGDTMSLQAFVSPDAGPDGRILEGQVHYFHPPAFRPLVEAPLRSFPKVAVVPALLDDDGELAEASIACGYEAIVVAAFGAGHVPVVFAERIERLARTVPVVVASRIGAGRTASRTYGFVGSEVDLVKRGAVLSSWIQPFKARLLLGALLASGMSRQQTLEAFMRWSTLSCFSNYQATTR